MLCFLESLGVNTKTLGVDTTIPVTQDKKKQIRFKNGAIVKLEILKGGELQVSLVYAGELAEDEDKSDRYYFDIENPDNIEKPDKKYIPIAFPKNVSDDSIHRIETTDENNIKVIYLVRHGQAEHNVKKGLGKWMQSIMGKKDTSLTDNGQTQATIAGKHFFAKVYTNKPIQNLFVGVSDLKRTSETAAYFLYDKIKTQNPLVFPYLHVIPCSHEIKKKESSCDGDINMRSNENIMDCKDTNIGTDACVYAKVTNKNNQQVYFSKKWDFYDEFYGTGRRRGLRAIRESKSFDDENLCRNTNMILELLKCAKKSNVYGTSGTEPIINRIGEGGKSTRRRLASKRKTKKRNRHHTKK
jgi:bisphosphoglycerate-dependent phosphoglycerate mutase